MLSYEIKKHYNFIHHTYIFQETFYMKRKSAHLLINSVLKRSSHKMLEKLATISHGIPSTIAQPNINKDQAYIEFFVYHNTCEFLLDPNFKLTRGVKGSLLNNQLAQSQKAKSNQELEQPLIEKKLLATIKMLNENKFAFAAYSEAQQTILMMTSDEAQQHKKYLVYIYKWILNQRVWGNKELQTLSNEFIKIVVDKIYEGHQKLEEQKKIKKELEIMSEKIKIKFQLEKKAEERSIDKNKK